MKKVLIVFQNVASVLNNFQYNLLFHWNWWCLNCKWKIPHLYYFIAKYHKKAVIEGYLWGETPSYVILSITFGLHAKIIILLSQQIIKNLKNLNCINNMASSMSYFLDVRLHFHGIFCFRTKLLLYVWTLLVWKLEIIKIEII